MKAIETTRSSYRAFIVILEKFPNDEFKATVVRNDSSKVVESDMCDTEDDAIGQAQNLLDEFLDN